MKKNSNSTIKKPVRQKPVRQLQNDNRNSYSITFGDLKIHAVGAESLKSVRNRVMEDALSLFIEMEKIKAMADSYVDDDDSDEEPDDDNFKKSKLKVRKKNKLHIQPDIMYG